MALLPPLPSAEWLNPAAQLVLKATLVLAAGGLATLLLRRASAAARHLAWTLSLAALLALPVLALAIPAWRVPLLPAAPAREATPSPAWTPPATADIIETPAATPLPSLTPPTETAAPPAVDSARWSGVRWLVAAWAAGALLVLLRLAVGLLSLRTLSRRAVAVTGEEWLFLYDELAYELRLKRPVRLLMGAGATMPMTFGFLRPAILLPSEAEEWDEERRRVVLLHEMAHVQRLDTLTQTLAQVCCALYWFHPGAWWASARMRAERERACDDRVLGAGARASAYATHLIEVARRFGSMRLAGAAAVAMARPSQLEGRVLAVLDEKAERRGLSRHRVALAAAGVLAVVLPLAAFHPVGRAAWAGAGRPVREMPAKDGKEMAPAMEHESAAMAAHDPEAAAKDTVNPAITAGLTAALADADVEVRRAAVHALAQQEDPRSVQPLLRAVADRDAEVRAAAVHALSQLGDRAAVPALIAALRDAEGEVRQAAIHALAELGDPRAAEPLRAALSDASPEVRKTAAMGLGELRDPAAVTALIGALRDADEEVRTTAAHALGEIGDRRAGEPLRAVLRQGPSEARKTAIHALAELEDASALPEISAALADADPEVRGIAAWAVAELGAREAPQALLDMAARDRSPEARTKALWAVAETGDRRGIPALRAALADSDAEVRKTAVWGLGELRDAASAEALVRLLEKDPDPEVRRAAAAALGEVH